MEGFISLVILVTFIILMDLQKKKDEKRKIANDLKKEIELDNKKELEALNNDKNDNTSDNKKYETNDKKYTQNKKLDRKKQEQERKDKELEKLKIKYFERKRMYPFEFVTEEKNNTFFVKTKGIISGPINKNLDVKFNLELWDVTNGREVIQVVNNKYNMGPNKTFYFEKIETIRPYGILIENLHTMTSIYSKYLKFPNKGLRKIEFKLSITDRDRRRTILSVVDTLEYYNYAKGYNDISPEEDFEEAVVKTAMIVSAIDGELTNSEASIIKTWIYNRIDDFDEEEYELEKKRMNTYIAEAYTDIHEKNLDIYDTLVNIDTSISNNGKLELFQVCLDVAMADNKVHDSELEIVYDIADYLDLHKKQYCKMVETTLPVNMHLGDRHVERILGIDLMVDSIEIRKHLLGEYKKWKNRVALDDKIVREQANQMIQLISKKREEYKI